MLARERRLFARRSLRARAAALLTAALATLSAACGEPPEKRPPKLVCPPPPEPTHQAVVVGTIGKLHLAESRYPLSKLGDVLTAFKPDLVLVGVRVDPYREGHLEDGGFEMTYVRHVARQRGIDVEPIDWFREQDFGVQPSPVEPWDESEIAKREAEVLSATRMLTFEQANAAELEEKVFLAVTAEARHRSGNPLVSRQKAWIQHLTASAVLRRDRPRRVLAFVDVYDRLPVDLALRTLRYEAKSPVEVVARSKETMVPDVPTDVVAEWKASLARARGKAEAATGPAQAFWAERAKVLEVAVERQGACCVTQAALTLSR